MSLRPQGFPVSTWIYGGSGWDSRLSCKYRSFLGITVADRSQRRYPKATGEMLVPNRYSNSGERRAACIHMTLRDEGLYGTLRLRSGQALKPCPFKATDQLHRM